MTQAEKELILHTSTELNTLLFENDYIPLVHICNATHYVKNGYRIIVHYDNSPINHPLKELNVMRVLYADNLVRKGIKCTS